MDQLTGEAIRNFVEGRALVGKMRELADEDKCTAASSAILEVLCRNGDLSNADIITTMCAVLTSFLREIDEGRQGSYLCAIRMMLGAMLRVPVDD